MPLPEDIQVLFRAKAQAKHTWQKINGLRLDPCARVFTFLGRMTHQKGCDLIVVAAEYIMTKYADAQLAMAGPVGDEYGEQALQGTERLATMFPGRVYNAAGQYVRGNNKEQLILVRITHQFTTYHHKHHMQATDFFLCPSRFEPCGLADLEFAFAGGVCVGHRTGGLGKIPGFYFEEDLDNTLVLSAGLQRCMEQAMQASWDEIHALAEEAAAKEFPPEKQVQRYNTVCAHLLCGRMSLPSLYHRHQVWSEIHCTINEHAKHSSKHKRPLAQEHSFYESLWRIDNLSATVRDREFTNTRAHRLATNIVLILMQV